MKHVSILVPRGQVILSSVVGAFKVFGAVNNYLKMTGAQSDDFFRIDLVGLDDERQLYNGLFSIKTTKKIEEVEKTDLIIVTTITGDLEEGIADNKDFMPWLRNQHLQNGAEIASLCTGAFLLAETGLMDGKSCSTHWISASDFERMFPKVKLESEKIICEDNGIYSSGGAYSFLNLILHLVEKHTGKEAALWAAKLFEIEYGRDNQNHFVIFQGQKEHLDDPIRQAQNFIESNFKEKLNVEALAEKFAISRRNFIRRFKKATSNTPLEYIQRVKVEAAKKQLETSGKNINEVMFEIGYSDDKAFRNLFRKYTGLTPNEYKSKYNLEANFIS